MKICEIVNNDKEFGLGLRVVGNTLYSNLPYIDEQIPLFEGKFQLRKLAYENMFVIGLNIGDVPMSVCRLSIGDVDRVSANYKQTLTFCLLSGCKSFYTLHNHPKSEIASPSPNDIQIEKTLNEISDIFDITFKGVVIIAKNQWSITHLGDTKYFDWDMDELEEIEEYEC